ncbi:low molecular weight protein-tyrosine-phosphatase [Amycolatopsis alkalitolerans]|uniref:protein-tyrosine-phosphatase n=1 Tax=Amycolatopsis alkalitolerans TaxID=2547244 RepID=A0A5C4LV66_9PSEU|nr:low molecular weight protein-tyrosine-phosphatase [Amycolatopsis alkalitolerans]TNC23149.1 low molecular weight phosphotyrosine protein phosphatase [Amycolatopsis alkalitolerans]
MTTLHICFVCSGNICRSPMAALVFGEHLRREGLAGRVRVTSAGTGPWHVGEPADARALATLEAAGYRGKHIASQIDEDHLEADLLLAADTGHVRDLRRKIDDPSRVRLLREFDPSAPEGAEVPDPYYGGGDGFDEVLAMIERTVPALVDWVRDRLGTLHV